MRVYLVLALFLLVSKPSYGCGESAFSRVIAKLFKKPQVTTRVVRAIPSAVRKQKLSAFNARDEFNITTTYKMLPQVKTEKLDKLEKFIPNSGTNENWFYRGQYKEKPVFIKTLDDTTDRFSDKLMINEARNYYLLDMLGLGPKFHGIVKVNGKIGVVLDNVEGVLVKWGNNPALRQQGIKIHPSAVRDIKLAASRLDQAGIHNPHDMQFIISPDGKKATLIDPEHFRTNGPDDGAKKAAEAVLESLKGYFVD